MIRKIIAVLLMAGLTVLTMWGVPKVAEDVMQTSYWFLAPFIVAALVMACAIACVWLLYRDYFWQQKPKKGALR